MKSEEATPTQEVERLLTRTLDSLAFLRRHLPSHGTHGEEMFNAFQTIESAIRSLAQRFEEVQGAHDIIEDQLDHTGASLILAERRIEHLKKSENHVSDRKRR